MAGAAIAPALNIIRLHFSYVPHLLVQLIVSSPALFIILTNLFFLRISRRYVYPTNFAIITSRLTVLSSTVITIIMVGLDVVAFFVGLAFGGVMHRFRLSVKYFAPLSFLMGYVFLLLPEKQTPYSIIYICLGSAFIGIATGIGVPYLNTIASIKGGRNSATTVMPLLSAALYLGQFVSPLVVLPLSATFFGEDDMTAPYKTGILLCLLLLLQVWATRHYQSLPPK